MLSGFSRDARYRAFLLLVAIIGIMLVLVATSRYGAGVSSDAARNLSTADSLLAGRGFVDLVGAPFVLWPPLYPALLAGFSLLSGLSTFHVGWYLNVFLHGLNLGLAGWWLYSIFPNKPHYAALGTLMILTSRSLLRLNANIASEPLFETLLLAFLLGSSRYLLTRNTSSVWLICLLAGLATLQRYLGVVMVGVAAMVLYQREGVRGLRRWALPLVAAAGPILAWLLLHNYALTGGLFGPRELGAMLPIQNISLGLTKILWWFTPRWGPLDWLVLHPLLSVGALVLILIALSPPDRWSAFRTRILSESMWPGLLFGLVYFFLLSFTVVTADHLDLTSDRYYVVMLPIVIALGLVMGETLVAPSVEVLTGGRVWAITAVVLLWFVYPIYAMQSYLREAVVQGEPTNYNIANSAQFREMSVVKAAEKVLAGDPQALVYTNYVNIAWFIFGHPVQTLPFEDQTLSRAERIEALRVNFPDWPTQPGYLVWFTPNQYHHIAAPDELKEVADLQLLFEDETGQIFTVRRRLP